MSQPSHDDETASACDSTCCGKDGARLPRRAFLKIAGLSAASGSLTGPLNVIAGPFDPPAVGESHTIPADKKLAPDWVARLAARGEPEIVSGKDLATVGMPVGGIGAGQLYLLGDGTLGCWEIFNRCENTGPGVWNYAYRTPDKPVAQGLAVVAEVDGRRTTHRLDVKAFPAVTFRGEYPIGRVRYGREDLPLVVELEGFSPFIPLNAADSGLPATVLDVTVTNTGDRPLRAHVLGWLENAVCCHSAPLVAHRVRRTTQAVRQAARATVLHGVRDLAADKVPARRPDIVLADFEGDDYGPWTTEGEAFGEGPAHGAFPNQSEIQGIEGRGLANSYQGDDARQGKLISPTFEINRRFLNFKIGGGRDDQGRLGLQLIIDGQVVESAAGTNNERLEWVTWSLASYAGRQAHIEIVDARSDGWGHTLVDHIELSDVNRTGPTGPIAEAADAGTMALALDGDALPAEATRRLLDAWEQGKPQNLSVPTEACEEVTFDRAHVSVLSSQGLALKPGERSTVTFVVTWHMPNRPHWQGPGGQAYAARFQDARRVADYVLDHKERLFGQTRLWRDTYYDSTLPWWLLDRLHSTVGNLATNTCQWWSNGRFWAWEGVCCCPGTCTHVWNYAQAVALLFPELERSVRTMQDLGDALNADGLVGFRGNRAYAADGQLGTVLKCYREHRMSADDAFLRMHWERIRRVMDYAIAQDGNDDGLIENAQHNTFDINFHGPNTFVGALYLAALRAAEQMALEMDDADYARKVRAIFESGSRLSAERLFNGEYFIQRVDLEEHPRHQYGKGCLSDQLFGQNWAMLLDLGYLYPPEMVDRALKSIYKYNWAPDVAMHTQRHKPWRTFAEPGEAGLITCTWPKSDYLPEGVLYRDEVWTGIEYQVASHMAREGILTESLILCRAAHDRYHPSKRNPYNEIECGDHYARALASWGVLLALAGYEHHGPREHLGFAPRITPQDFRCAFTAATGWGTFAQKRSSSEQRDTMTLRYGTLRLKTLALAVPDPLGGGSVDVRIDGRPAACRHTREEADRLVIELEETQTLTAGQTLEVVLA